MKTQEDECIWDKFTKEDCMKLVKLVDKADKLLEKIKENEERKDSK